MMRFCLITLVCGAIAVAVQPAPAADMPMVTKAPTLVAPSMSWTGFYVGGHIGGAWASSDWGYSNSNPYSATGPGIPPTPLQNGFDPSGWVAGGQAGYNYQVGQWVLGVEVTGSATDLNQTVANVVQYPPVASVFVGTKISSLFTAAGRVGFLVAPSWLLYAKGGYAGGNIETSGGFVPPFLGFNFKTTEWHNGWTVGVGAEYRVAKNITVGVAYDFIDLMDKTHTGLTVVGPVIHPVQADIQMVTARVNFLFGPN